MHSLNEELHRAVEELNVANETLEQRVQERTTELTSTNEELQRTNAELPRQVRRRLAAEEEAGDYARQQEIINRVIKAGNESQDLTSALASMLDNALTLMGFDGGAVYLLDSGREAAELQYASPASSEILQTIPRTSAHIAQIYRGEPEFVDDVPTNSSLTYHPSAATTAHIPLTSKEAVTGHYVVLGTLPHHFSSTEKELLVALGREAGTVIARMQAEEDLRASVRYARSLIEVSLDPLVTISAEGKITDVNQATEMATGFSREELIGSDFSNYFTEPAAAKTGYKRVFTFGYVKDYPLAIRHKSGSITDVLYNATIFMNDSGEIQGVFAAARDITEQKQTQDALNEANEEVRLLYKQLQSTNEELTRHSQHLAELIAERTSQLRDAERLAGIGETAAMIGHDLRNPLQGLQYIVDLQKLRFERITPEKRGAKDWKEEEALFDRISEQVFYTDKIVADLQDYARPIAPETEAVAIGSLINDVLASLPHTDHVRIISDVSDLAVTADSHLMHRVLANLILNALQAMPERGTLTINASTCDDAVAINVRDTGLGIPEEMKDKLFSPLITGKAKGTGLGLAVVKRIVDAHGGTITFESAEGKGTTFTVTLPSRGG